MDRRTGVLEKISEWILYIGNNIETVARVALAGALSAALVTVTRQVLALTAAIAANPIGAILIAITAALSTLTLFSDQIELTGTQFATLADFGVAAWEEIKIGAQESYKILVETLEDLFGPLDDFKKRFTVTFRDVMIFLAQMIDSGIGTERAVFVTWFQFLKSLWLDVANGGVWVANKILQSFRILQEGTKLVFESIAATGKFVFESLKAGIQGLGSAAGQLMSGNYAGAASALSGIFTQIDEEAKKADDSIQAFFINGFNSGKFSKALIPEFKYFGDGFTNPITVAIESFKKSQEEHTLEDYMYRTFARANKRALDRFRAQKAAEVDPNAKPDLNSPIDPDTGLKTLREVVLDRYIKKLNDETDALRLSNRERDVQEKLLKLETEIRSKNVQLSDDERASLEITIRKQEALKDAQRALERLKNGLGETAGATEKVNAAQGTFNTGLDELTDGLQNGQLTVDQFNEAIDHLVINITRAFVIDELVHKLEEQIPNLSLGNRERGVQNELLREELELRKKGIELSPDEAQNLEFLIRRKDVLADITGTVDEFESSLGRTRSGFAQLADLRGKFTSQVDELLESLKSGKITVDDFNFSVAALNRDIRLQADIYAQIQDPAIAYEETLRAIAEVSKLTSNSTEQLNLELAKTSAAYQKVANDPTFFGGIERGVLRAQMMFTDLGSLVESTITGAFGHAEDALVDFVRTGKASFKEFADSLLSDLTRIVVRAAVIGPIANLLGGAFGGGNLFAGTFGGFRAGGGDVEAGKEYVVGEKGPEILRMGTRGGYVVPNGNTSNTSNKRNPVGPIYNNTTINVSTPDADSFRRSQRQVLRGIGRSNPRR